MARGYESAVLQLANLMNASKVSGSLKELAFMANERIVQTEVTHFLSRVSSEYRTGPKRRALLLRESDDSKSEQVCIALKLIFRSALLLRNQNSGGPSSKPMRLLHLLEIEEICAVPANTFGLTDVWKFCVNRIVTVKAISISRKGILTSSYHCGDVAFLVLGS